MFQYDLGPPKHVLHLVWSVLGISTAIKTALKVALYDFFDGPLAPSNGQFIEKVNHYNRTIQINFLMGPSIKFVLAISGLRVKCHKKKPKCFLSISLTFLSNYFQEAKIFAFSLWTHLGCLRRFINVSERWKERGYTCKYTPT